MKKLMKCSICGNIGEFSYLGSRNLNRKGEISDIIGNQQLWMSYFKCPECGSIEVEFHPAGNKPDIPKDSFKEVIVEDGENSNKES